MSSRVVGVACAFTVAVAAVSEAKTIAWYHFDDYPLGATNLCADVITNAVDPDSLPMCARWVTGKPQVLNDDDTVLSDADRRRMPRYVNVLPEGYSWLDCSNENLFGRNRRGIQLNPVDGSSASGLLCVMDDATEPKLHLQTFTVEMFIRFSKAFTPTSQSRIFDIVTGSAEAGWTSVCKVLIQKPTDTQASVDEVTGGWVYGQLRIGGETKGGITSQDSGNLLDGDLHHLAIVRTPTSFAVYIDYKRSYSYTGSNAQGQLDYGDGQQVGIFFGASPLTEWGRLPAFIDEIRISDAALTDSTKWIGFSQLAENDPLVSDETLVYQTFDGFGSDLSGGFAFSNMATSDQALPLTYYKATGGAKPTAVTDDAPAETLKNGMLAEESLADKGCWQFDYGETNGVSAMLSINDTLASGGLSHSIYESDSTIEFFVKYPTAPTKTEYLWCSQLGTSGHITESTRIFVQGTTLYIGLCSQEEADAHLASGNPGYTVRSVAGKVADGDWHHVALVNARSEKNVYCYFDGALIGTPVENFLLATNAYPAISSRMQIRISGKGTQRPGANDLVQFTGELDSLRVTARALAPNEFISTRGELSLAKGTAFYMPFDGDYARYPLTTGAEPTAVNVTFSDKVPGDGVVSNRVAMGLADMTDVKSASFEDGFLKTTDVAQLIGLQSFTVEFYARMNGFGTWPLFAALEGVKNSNTYCTWSIRPTKSQDDSAYDSVVIMIDNLLGRSQALRFGVAELADRKWHHYAVTFEKIVVENEEKTEVRLYVDGVARELLVNEVNPGTYYLDGGVSRYQYGTPMLCFGKHDGGTIRSFTGLLDEFRISEGVLAPEDFLRVGPAPRHGILLIVR